MQDASQLVPFTIHTFLTAGIIGVIIVAILAVQGQRKIQARNIAAGILLGIPNYFSIYYLVRFLNTDVMQSSAAIPVNNIGIVLASALCGIFAFKENTSATRIIGLILSLGAILLIAFGD